jgi:hypothetical protein
MMDLKKNSWDGMQNEKMTFILIDGTECNMKLMGPNESLKNDDFFLMGPDGRI